jgi:hypothetical protein
MIDDVQSMEQYRAMKSRFLDVVLIAAVGWAVGASIGCGSVQGTQPDAGQPPADGSTDTAPPSDTPISTARYDVGYVDSVTLTSDVTALQGFIAIVNTGTEPLKLSTASVVTFSDDSLSIEWALTRKDQTTATINPNRASGFLTPLAQDKIVATGVVSEPFDEKILNFGMTFQALNVGDVLHAEAVLGIDNTKVTLPFTVTVAAGQADIRFNNARRISARP